MLSFQIRHLFRRGLVYRNEQEATKSIFLVHNGGNLQVYQSILIGKTQAVKRHPYYYLLQQCRPKQCLANSVDSDEVADNCLSFCFYV